MPSAAQLTESSAAFEMELIKFGRADPGFFVLFIARTPDLVRPRAAQGCGIEREISGQRKMVKLSHLVI